MLTASTATSGFTAGLDRRSQARVERAVDRAATGRTCLVVTHDLRAAAAADLVLVLDRGRIVDAGTHTALAARSQAYRSLFHLQAEAGLPSAAVCA